MTVVIHIQPFGVNMYDLIIPINELAKILKNDN
ncbi:MAG: hypothetical protein PWR20_1856 [Bacteroidales bacterium]|jgi:hypothetical protein|nr:hypothetical protein [Bacteroidales bacterium]